MRFRTILLAFGAACAFAAEPTGYGAIGAGEGPVSDLSGNLYFTGGDRITKRDTAGNVSVFREPSGGANGLLFDHEGRLIVCEARNRRVVRIEKDGAVTVLTDGYESKKYNSPNDLTIDSRGRIYFSDPRYGKRDNMEMPVEGVYRIDAPGKVTRVIGSEVERANGLFVSQGDKYLYVADNNNNTAGGARKLWRFTLRPDGGVDAKSRRLIFDWKDGRGPDGIKMDREGRLYVAAGRNEPNQYETAGEFKGGVYVLSPEGKLLNFVAIPKDEVTNCAFGGPDWKRLFVTAGGTLWSIPVSTPGWVPYAAKTQASVPAPSSETAFFESKIRPVLVAKCYGCHSSKLPAPMGALTVDSAAGLLKGGATGPAVVPGKPFESRLLQALTYKDAHLHMPPSGKLPDAVIADFEQWIAAGAADPRTATPNTSAALKGMPVEEGRKWWAFQPLPKATGDPIDGFILAKLREKGLKPSAPADARTLVRRVYVDLVGYKPTFEEVEAFANDKAPDAYQKLIDRLLASERYGERWGRHWMDVARFGEDNPTGEATNPPYPFAWRYRDWIIEAINKDVPYDRFVKLQLAADLMPDATRDDLRALGYLGAAPVYHKDLRLSEQVIGGFLTDDWDERIDAVSRGLLGLTVACARCHDHKFDPIPTKDYYGLAGVFASTMRTERPLFDVDREVEARYSWLVNRLFDLKYSINLLTNEASTVVDSESRVAKWKVDLEALKQEALGLQERYPKLVQNIEKHWTFPPRRQPGDAAAAAAAPQRRNRILTSIEPFTNAVYEAAQYIDGSDQQFTVIHYKPGEARDVPVLKAGNVATPGEIVPRHFPLVLAKGDPNFKNGSGRLELADRIFSDSAPLAARIIVNRVWDWHIGKPLAGTPSDFGVQGEKPAHPELLDQLAARFIAHGWSLKWLHREIMLSQTYRQASTPRADASKVDAANALVWRMNPRRMDIESYRDTLLRASGRLDERMYGVSEDLQLPANVRRTVYGRVSRGRMSTLLKNYDFPDPMQTAGGRELTITPLQQLFVMNSPFLRDSAVALSASVSKEADDTAKMRSLFRKVLSRDPSPKELDLALSYLANGTIEQYAQVLLSTNEEIFWP